MNSIKVNERVFKKILTSLKDCVAKRQRATCVTIYSS